MDKIKRIQIAYKLRIQIRALVMGDGVPCYGALEIVGLLLLLLF